MPNPSCTRLVEGDSDACSSCDYVSPGSSGDAYLSTSNHHHKSFVSKRHIGDINNFDIALRISNAEEPTDVHDVYSSFNRIFGVLLVVKFKKTVGNVNVHARAQVVSNSVSASATASIQENPSGTLVCPKENSTIHNGDVYEYIHGMDVPVPPIYNMNGDDDMRGAECLQSRDLSDNNSVNNSVEEIGSGCGNVDEMTQIGELSEIERQVVDRLISLGDIIEQKCGGEIDELLDSLRGIKSPTESLCRIAQLIFKEVRLNWGRILVFFYFGIRYFLQYAADYLTQGLVNLCSRVVSALRDICTAGIFQWIADHGGWRRLMYSEGTIVEAVSRSSVCWPSFGKLLLVVVVIFFTRRFRGSS